MMTWTPSGMRTIGSSDKSKIWTCSDLGNYIWRQTNTHCLHSHNKPKWFSLSQLYISPLLPSRGGRKSYLISSEVMDIHVSRLQTSQISQHCRVSSSVFSVWLNDHSMFLLILILSNNLDLTTQQWRHDEYCMHKCVWNTIILKWWEKKPVYFDSSCL